VIDISKKICRVLDWIGGELCTNLSLMSVRRQCKAFMLTIKQKPKLDLKFMLHVQIYVTMLLYARINFASHADFNGERGARKQTQ